MQDLLAQSSFDKLKEGAIVPGTITEVRQNEVVVDIGGKSEGVIPANEFIDIGDLQIGSTIEVLVEKLEDRNGSPILSFDKAEQKKNWDNILTRFPEGSVATGRVKAKVKGGLIISIGVDAFMPASHIDVQPPKNLDQYVGQTYDFKVLKINLDRKNIVLSRRELIEQQRAEKRRALLDSIQPGQFRKGIVKNITDFGAFIDLDGLADTVVFHQEVVRLEAIDRFAVFVLNPGGQENQVGANGELRVGGACLRRSVRGRWLGGRGKAR